MRGRIRFMLYARASPYKKEKKEKGDKDYERTIQYCR